MVNLGCSQIPVKQQLCHYREQFSTSISKNKNYYSCNTLISQKNVFSLEQKTLLLTYNISITCLILNI